MKSLDFVLDAILDVAKAVAPLISPNAGAAIGAAVDAGNRVVELIDHAKDVMDGDVSPALLAQREEIETRVRAHVESTAAKLEGGQPA